jgi:peptide/nickel transport system ATP-binding protein
MALLLITHDLGVVAQMADHVAVMQHGRVLETGPTRALFTTMAHPYTRDLLAASRPAPRAPRVVTGPAVLRATDVARHYQRKRQGLWASRPAPLRAVDGVTFTLARGESLGLVGESGCGKSTLTRALLGLEDVQRGTIHLGQTPVSTAMPTAARAAMQVVFQDPYGSFNPRWRVGDLVAEPFHLTGRPADATARVAAALQAVGLQPQDADKYPHAFSGGQRQRIAIARALITEPQVLILDEAVSALDVRVRAQVLGLLDRLQTQRGLSYLFITHDLTVVRAITDRVMVMQSGRIVEEGPTQSVFDAPAHPYTAQLIAAAPRIPPDWLPEDHSHDHPAL